MCHNYFQNKILHEIMILYLKINFFLKKLKYVPSSSALPFPSPYQNGDNIFIFVLYFYLKIIILRFNVVLLLINIWIKYNLPLKIVSYF
jgi:hypothetical protein